MRTFINTALIALSFLACSSSAFSDGLPFNKERTHLRGEVEILKLTSQQGVEVSRQRTLTLTAAQLEGLRKKASACPPVLSVLTNRYDDCTCGMASLAVWFRPGEVEIPIPYLPKNSMAKEEEAEFGPDVPHPPDIILDETLAIWCKGKRIKEKQLKSTILHRQAHSGQSHRRENGITYICIDTPYALPLRKGKKLGTFVARLQEFALRNQIDLFVWGFRQPNQ